MAEYAAYAAIASAAVGVGNAVGLFGNNSGATGVSPPPPPGVPQMAPTMNSPEVQQAGINQRQRAAVAGGVMSNIATSPSGLTTGAPTTGKTLLGS